MARIYTKEIDGDEYIGESLQKINDNFQGLDSQQQSLSAVISEIRASSSLSLDLVGVALTSVRDINIRLNDRGVFYSPHAFYVSLTGNDLESGSIAFPFLTIDKAINAITNVAKNTPKNSSNINKLNDFYIILKDAATYSLSSAITLGNIPGTVHFVGSTLGETITANLVKPSSTFNDPVNGDNIIPEWVFDTTLGEVNLRDYTSLKVYQTFGKNVIPIPGYVRYSTGGKGVYGFNNPSFMRLLSAKTELESIRDDRFYNYILAGNEIKQIEKVINHNFFEVTTPFSSTVSGTPLFLANKNNWHYSQIDPLQRLATAGSTDDYNVYNATAVAVISSLNGIPYNQGSTKYETGNILHFNGKTSFALKAYPLSANPERFSGIVFLDNAGTLFTDRLSSKTQLPPTDVTVQGVVGLVPFYEKTFFELYRGVYDRVEYTAATVVVSAGNYQRSTANIKYNTLLNTVRIPRTFSIRMPSNTGIAYIQPLPTTIFFTNTGSAGFKLKGTSLHLQNVYVRGPRNSINTFDIVDVSNIGVQATDKSIAVIDSDCAIANFSIGVHAVNDSCIVIGGNTDPSIEERNALTVTDNSIGAIIENGSSLYSNGSRLVIGQNYQDGLVVRNGSKAYLQFTDIFHNGGTGIISTNNSSVSIGSVCLIGNRYGANCTHNSELTISPKLLQDVPDGQPYPYYSPNLIYCNGIIDNNATTINVAQNSRLVLEETNLVKNSLSGTTIRLEDTSTGYIDSTTLFCTRNNSSANAMYGIGISTSNNSVIIKNTSIFEAQTAIKVNPNVNLTLENIFISQAGVGIGVTDNTRVDITFTSYPSSNNVINSTNQALYIEGNQNTITSFMESTNFRLSSVACMGLNNYCAIHTDVILKPMVDNFIFPQDARNTLNSRDNKIRTASYPRLIPRSGGPDPFGITY